MSIEAKAQLVRERDMAMMEIDLSSLVESYLEPERLRELVLAEPDNRKWIRKLPGRDDSHA